MKMTTEVKTLPNLSYIKQKFPDFKTYSYVFEKYFKEITKEDKEKMSFIFKNEKELSDIILKLKNKDFSNLSLNFYENFFRILKKDDFKIFFSLNEMNREHTYIVDNEIFIIEAFDNNDDSNIYFNYKQNLNNYMIEGEGYIFNADDTININKKIKEIKEKNINKNVNHKRCYGLSIDEWEKDYLSFKKSALVVLKNYLKSSNKKEEKRRFLNLLNINDENIKNIENIEKYMNIFLKKNDIDYNYKKIILEIKNEDNKIDKINNDIKKINSEFSLI